MSNPSEQPRLTQVSVSSSLGEYLQRLKELGAVEGAGGDVELNPTLAPVLEALHHVLAGGEVQVHVVQSGHQDILRELQERISQALQETNTLQQQLGEGAEVAV